MTINNNNIFGVFTLNEARGSRLTGDWLNKESVANYGWFIGGTDYDGSGVASSYVDRIDFSNDSATALVRGLLTVNIASHVATGNSNYGWFGGGVNPTTKLSRIDRIDFSNDSATPSPRGPLSAARYGLAAVGNSNYGWFVGGTVSTPTSFYSTVDRVDFSNDSTTTSVRSPLSDAKRYLAATGNSNYGWFGGGYVPGGTAFTKSTLDRIDFSNDLTITSIRGSMSSARYLHVATGNSNYGWFGSGRNQLSTVLASIDRMDLSNDLVTGNVRSSFTSYRGSAAASGNSNFGWCGGGALTIPAVEKLNFSNDSISRVGSLSVRRSFLAATSGVLNIRRQKGGNFGWFTGGTRSIPGFQSYSHVYRIDFSNDLATPSPRGKLTHGKAWHAATGNSNYGWFANGSTQANPQIPVSYVDRIDYSNDSVQASPRGLLTNNRWMLAATGNSNYGWFGGGYNPATTPLHVATVDRINFSNDLATASPRGPLSAARYRLSATGNSNYGWFGGGVVTGGSNRKTVDRIDFSNDSGTASTRGSLSANSGTTELSSVSNTNFGWFGGGSGSNTIIDRIDFSNDSGTASVRGLLTAAIGYGGGAAGNSNYGWFGGSYGNISNRLDFSNDLITVTPRSMSTIQSNPKAATSNTNK